MSIRSWITNFIVEYGIESQVNEENVKKILSSGLDLLDELADKSETEIDNLFVAKLREAFSSFLDDE